MGTATWSTAPIPAYRLAVGDRITFESTTVTLTTVEEWGRSVILGPIQGDIDVWTVQVDYLTPVAVHVPDEPVDGYSLWRPKPGVWPSGCVCLIRANPKTPSNWETVVRDETCRGHYDWNDYED
jgi:hypothetical protein